MDRDLDPEERQYKEIYEAVERDVLSKRDPRATMRDLMQEGYTEREAIQWIEAVRQQVLRQSTSRSIAGIIAGVFLMIAGVGLWFGSLGAVSFLLFMLGIIVTLGALSAWARYTK